MDEHRAILAQITRICKDAIEAQDGGKIYEEPLCTLIPLYCDLLRTRVMLTPELKKAAE